MCATPCALDDVADLVVRMAVVGRAAGLDDPDELRQLPLVQDAERALRRRHAPPRGRRSARRRIRARSRSRPARRRPRRAGRPHRVGLAGEQQDAGLGLEGVLSPSRWSVPSRTGRTGSPGGRRLDPPAVVDLDDADGEALVDALCRQSVRSRSRGRLPTEDLASREASMLPPDTMQTTSPSGRPGSAAASASAPAPSAITRTRSARAAPPPRSRPATRSAPSTSCESMPHIFGSTSGAPAPSTNDGVYSTSLRAGRERGRERRAGLRLDREDLRLGPQRLDGARDAGSQAAAAVGDHDRVRVGQVLEHLEPDRAVPGHDLLVLDRMDEEARRRPGAGAPPSSATSARATP